VVEVREVMAAGYRAPYGVYQTLEELGKKEQVGKKKYPKVMSETEKTRAKWAEVKERAFHAAVGEDAFVSLRSYSGDGYYGEMNWALRGEPVETEKKAGWRETIADILPMVSHLDAAIRRTAEIARAGECWAYRGMRYRNDEEYAEGRVVVFGSYTSVSRSVRAARSFARSAESTLCVVRCPGRAASLTAVGEYPHEIERLMARGVRLRVVRRLPETHLRMMGIASAVVVLEPADEVAPEAGGDRALGVEEALGRLYEGALGVCVPLRVVADPTAPRATAEEIGAVVERALASATRGRGRVILLRGDAGAWKTTALLKEVVGRARKGGGYFVAHPRGVEQRS